MTATRIKATPQGWTDYVVWLHEYIVATVDERLDRAEVAARLLRCPKVLKQHVLTAIDLVDAACAGDAPRYREVEAAWEDSTDDEFWRDQAALVKQMLTARLEGNYDLDVKAFDQLLAMADRFGA